MMKETFDFKKVGITSNTAYLQPGTYTLTARDAKYVKPDGKKPDGSPKTSYLQVTFGGEAGQIDVKFYITPKAFERLQTIYTNWFGQPCDKVFDSTDAIGAFFEKAFTSEKAKKTFKRMVIGGRQVGDKVYADLPFSRYIVSDEAEDWKEGPFVKGSGEWIYHVRVEANASTTSEDVMLPTSSIPSAKEDFADDLPF